MEPTRRFEGSLKLLKVDAIDLYYQHRVDPNVILRNANVYRQLYGAP